MSHKQKRQFSGTSKTRPFFDRRVRSAGHTVILSVGKVIPHTWNYVRIERVDADENSVTIKITKLLETSNHAQNNTANKGCQQDA